jgi:parallel beta-helix repeat protein
MKIRQLTLLIIALIIHQTIFATTITVCTSGCDHTTISAAISAATAGDIIDIQDAIHTEANIAIDKNLTIQGQGQTTTTVQANAVQADAEDGVFKILTVGLTITFQNMTIRNGNADGAASSTLDTGGAIYIRCNASTNVTFDHVTISNNKSLGDRGGGVYITDDGTGEGTVTFTNCVIKDNEATGSGGDGGGIANRGANVLTMTKCTISGNTAGDDGGGFYVSEDGSTNKFINCTIYNNSGGGSSGDEGRGGGFFLSSTSTFEFYNCTIVDNSLNTVGTRQGGGIYHTSMSTLDLTNTIVANNSGATDGNDIYTSNNSSTFTQTTSLVEDCAEGGGTCPSFSYFGDPNLAAVAMCGEHAYFPTSTRSFASDNGTAPAGNIPTDDICGTNRSAAKYDIGSYDDGVLSTGLIESTGDIEVYFNALINYLPATGLNNFAEPTSGNLTTWTSIITKLLANNTTGAETDAATIDYQVVLLTDNSVNPHKLYYLLQKTALGTNFWGTYVFNPAPCREIIIQAPHAVHDSNTGHQGAYCLKHTNARAFMITGTHRCNHTTATTCDGLSTVCTGSDAPFKISDMSHNSNNCFQTTSNKLHDDLPSSVLIQLHGFTWEMGDPDVILSNGTTIIPSGTDYANDFKTHLFNADGTLTFEVAHINNWTRLIGTTNTQGRYINGESDPCKDPATAATGRFIHVEQVPELRNDATGWAKVSTAMENLITCVALPVELIDINARLHNEAILLNWTTATENNNKGFFIERVSLGNELKDPNQFEWEALDFVQGQGTTVEIHNYSYKDKKPLKGLNYYRLKQVDVDGIFKYSPIVSVNFSNFSNTEKLRIIPNPVNNGNFSLILPEMENEFAKLDIFNATGQFIKSQSIYDSNTIVDVQSLPKGVYWLSINIDGKSLQEKLIIQ